MTERSSPSESKLLCLPRSYKSAGLFRGNRAIAVQIGAKSSKAALVDTSNAEQLLIFQLSFTGSGRHLDDCLNFLADWDDKDRQLQTVFVNRMLPEFSTERLSTFSDKFKVTNYPDHVAKAVPLIADLTALHPHELFHATDEAAVTNIRGSPWSLIDSSETGSRVIRVSPGNGSCQTQTEALRHSALHSQLEAAKRSLTSRFVTSNETNQRKLENDIGSNSEEQQGLTAWLRQLSWSEQTAAFHQDFASIVQPALKAYFDAIRSELHRAQDQRPILVAISDCLFANQFCRDSLLKEIRTDDDGAHVTVLFVRDGEFLGMLGSLTTC